MPGRAPALCQSTIDVTDDKSDMIFKVSSRETANECHYDISKVLLFVAAQLIQQLISKLECSIVILKTATYHADYVCRVCFNTYNSIVMMFCRRRKPRS